MMSEAHSNQILYLVIFIAVLMLAILFPLAVSVLRKKPETKSIPEKKHDLPIVSAEEPISKDVVVSLQGTSTTESVKAVPVHLEPVQDEKEISLSEALSKTEESFFGRIKKAFSNSDKKKVLEDIEEVLYTSDLGPQTVERLLQKVQSELSGSDMSDIKKVKQALYQEMSLILNPVHYSEVGKKNVLELIRKSDQGPTVLMVVGVNGAGKTTSIGKITAQLASLNQKVLVAAGDTFRAAAGGQLKVWTERAQSASSGQGAVEIFWPENTQDPAAVAFDAVSKAKSRNYDYVILDTAGRLHTQSNLMEELKKVKRVMTKVIPEAPHETWIVLDANSGQNALNQAVEFNKALELSGVVMTKMDGTAKGGVALGVVHQLNKPIKLIGIGEKIQDLRLFNPEQYIESILGKN